MSEIQFEIVGGGRGGRYRFAENHAAAKNVALSDRIYEYDIPLSAAD